MAMTARMRRLASDYEQIKKDFVGHKNIRVTAVDNEDLPEKYHVTYFVPGIYLLPDGQVASQTKHEVDITLHADYPRYKPICKITTPIWHPNFRDGQICIGDIWGAGESLSDIIINIGDMIQYKSWNASSPLSADAAQWAIENQHLFPVGHEELHIADPTAMVGNAEIDLFEEGTDTLNASAAQSDDGNDFEITAEELQGIEFVPTSQRMAAIRRSDNAKGKVNLKTILVKGLLWALIGALVGFGLSEVTKANDSQAFVAGLLGYSYLEDYYDYSDKADREWDQAYAEYEAYCKTRGLNAEDESVLRNWYLNGASEEASRHIGEYFSYDGMADDALYKSFQYEFHSDEEALKSGFSKITRLSTGVWSAIIALCIGLFLGIGEGVFYGSSSQAVKYALIGAGVSLVLGLISGYLAQWMYSSMLGDDPSKAAAALIRGAGWAVMGLGIGIGIGLIKPETKRILFCSIGGLCGAFIGGSLFNYVCDIIPNDLVARGIAIVIMGGLIGVGVGLLEQFAKQAWLKVIRGEFEGKEYLVFSGTTSIGNNGRNTIVLFKDKLVGPHHCDIVQEGRRFAIVDCGTPMGTVVNGRKVNSRLTLKEGDSISIGNSVLVFHSK